MKHIPLSIALLIVVVASSALIALTYFSDKAQNIVLPLISDTVVIQEPTEDEIKQVPKTIVINESGEGFVLDVEYPSDVPQEVREYVETQVKEFREVSGENQIDSLEYDFKLRVEKYETSKYESYVVEATSYTGGANSNDVVQAFAYRSGEQVSFREITNAERITRDIVDTLESLCDLEWNTIEESVSVWMRINNIYDLCQS